MSLENLARQIGQDAHERARETAGKAQSEANAIVEAAKNEAHRIAQEAQEEAKRTIVGQRGELVAAAHLEAGKMLAHARDEAVEESLRLVWAEVAHTARGRDYPRLLMRLVQEGVREVGQPCVVRIRRRDAAAAKKAGVVFEQKEFEECSGGAVVEREDGKISSRRTLEALFEEKRETARSRIYESLFGKGG